MLRRRIFSSAMASVMALSSVAVVANAEETASAVKSKADLEAYVNSFDSFRSNELYDYGSISGENFLNALEYADNVLADDESSEDDYTVAYAMIEAVYNSLTIYTVEELKALVASCTGIYETNNIYNEELGDARYDADSFSTFEGAYEEADSVLDSNDSRIITDAYEQLEAAKKNLAPLTAVSKSQFRTAIKAYEAALQTEWDYDTWRVGTIDTGWAYWGYQGQTVAFGTLYDHAASLEGTINTAYEELDEIKALNKTTAPNLVDAYNACVAATTVLKGFTPDDTNRATKDNVKSLLNQYHGRLVYDYNSTSAEELYEKVLDVVGEDNITVLQSLNEAGSTDYFAADEVTDPFCIDDASYTVDPNGGIHKGSVTKLISAELTIKSTVAYYICLDDDGFWNGTVSLTKPVDGKYKLISKKSAADLTAYIPVTSDMLTADTDNHKKNNVIDGDGPFEVVDAATNGYSGNISNGVSHYWGNADGLSVGDAAVDTKQIGQWGAISSIIDGNTYKSGTIDADQEMNGTTVSGNPTFADLADAMTLAEIYIAGDKAAIAESGIYAIDTTDSIAAGSAKGSSAEWTMVYRYLKYALADKYDASYGTHTKAEVVELIDKCYELAELTGDAALFATNHNKLVTARQDALDWVKAANKDKKYKDNVSAPEIAGGAFDGYIATDVYNSLWGQYEKLQNDYNAFKYSYDDIYEAIANAKILIDDGDITGTPELLAAIEKTALKLSTIDVLYNTDGDEIEENEAFTSDRFFQGFNRVMTKDEDYTLATDSGDVKVAHNKADGKNWSHGELVAAYEAMQALIDAQLNPAVKLGDVDGNGTVNALDAAALLKNVVNGVAMDLAVADYDASGAANALDAAAILKAVVNGTAN